MNLNQINQISPFLLFAMSLWTIAWMGLGLYRAASLKQKNWFLAILLIHIMGIIEIAYLFYFAKKRLTIAEIKSWFVK